MRTLIGFPVVWTFGRIDGPSPEKLFNLPRIAVEPVRSDRPSNNIVLIVDESVRGDHLSLNAPASSKTPALDDLNRKGFVKNWGIAAAGSTCSVGSNNLILTGVNQLPDRDYKVYVQPTLFQFAKAMGYRTFHFDAQASNVWNGKPYDLQYVDVRVLPDDLRQGGTAEFDLDAQAAARVRAITEESGGNFILVNKRGVHKPYTGSYPGADNSHTVDSWYIPYDVNISTEALIAEYDAAISYNLQQFFSALFSVGGPAANNFFIYTSDHGQTLRENGATVSHCSESRPEAAVPLFLISRSIDVLNIDSGYKASHSNIFATVLDLMNFPEENRGYPYSKSLLKARAVDSVPRFYCGYDINGLDGGRIFPFD